MKRNHLLLFYLLVNFLAAVGSSNNVMGREVIRVFSPQRNGKILIL